MVWDGMQYANRGDDRSDRSQIAIDHPNPSLPKRDPHSRICTAQIQGNLYWLDHADYMVSIRQQQQL